MEKLSLFGKKFNFFFSIDNKPRFLELYIGSKIYGKIGCFEKLRITPREKPRLRLFSGDLSGFFCEVV